MSLFSLQKYLEKLRRYNFKKTVYDMVQMARRSEAMVHQLRIAQRFMFSFLEDDRHRAVDPESNVCLTLFQPDIHLRHMYIVFRILITVFIFFLRNWIRT